MREPIWEPGTLLRSKFEFGWVRRGTVVQVLRMNKAGLYRIAGVEPPHEDTSDMWGLGLMHWELAEGPW